MSLVTNLHLRRWSVSDMRQRVGGGAPGVERGRWLALGLLCASQLMVILDGSIVAVALPVIGTKLDLDGTGLAWVVNGYLVVFGGLLLFAGRLGDLGGPRRVLLGGLAVFTAASAWCGLASSAGELVAARIVQGAGAALASSVVLGMIVTLFREEAERRRALAVFSFVGAGGASIGLLAGGLLTQGLSWRWIFLVNVPIGVAALVGVRLRVPVVPASRGQLDVVGAVLVTGGLMAAVYGLLATGLTSRVIAILGAGAVALLGAFCWRQARAATPLLPLRLLASRTTGLGNLVQALMVAGLFGFQYLGVVYLEQLLGYDPLRAGLAFLPVPVAIAVVSLGASARLIAHLGEHRVLLVGLAFIVAGLGLLSQLPAHASYVSDVLPAGLLVAAGFGTAYPALAAFAVGGAPPRDAGVASGLFNTTQQVGGALGLAVLTRLAVSASNARRSHLVADLGGYHVAFAAAAGLVAAGLAVAVIARKPTVADGEAADINDMQNPRTALVGVRSAWKEQP